MSKTTYPLKLPTSVKIAAAQLAKEEPAVRPTPGDEIATNAGGSPARAAKRR